MIPRIVAGAADLVAFLDSPLKGLPLGLAQFDLTSTVEKEGYERTFFDNPSVELHLISNDYIRD